MSDSGDKENMLFRKVELWVILIILLITFVGFIAYGAIVRQVTLGGKRTGVIGTVAYSLASVPSDLKDMLVGSRPDYITHAMNVSSHDRDAYSTLPLPDDSFDQIPIAWVNPNQAQSEKLFQPAVMMFRLNEKGDEHLVLFDDKRNVVKNFPVTAGSLSGEYRPLVGNSSPRILDDGSYIIHSHGSDGLYRKDVCGNIIWSVPGIYHHSFSIANGKIGILGLAKETISVDEQKLWNSSDILNIIDVETGNVERSVPLIDIVRNNASESDPFMLHQWFNKLNENNVIEGDLVHLNKLQILPDDLAAEYPGLPAGAWMLSSRGKNLVFIVDPQTLKIVWHTQGHTQAQHDPDYVGNNKIVVVNNGFSRNSDTPEDQSNFSSIREFVVGTDEWRVLYSGADINGYTKHSGEVDTGTDGQMLLALTVQGRYVELSNTGELLAEFINVRDEESVYWVKSAQYLTTDQFHIIKDASCSS